MKNAECMTQKNGSWVALEKYVRPLSRGHIFPLMTLGDLIFESYQLSSIHQASGPTREVNAEAMKNT